MNLKTEACYWAGDCYFELGKHEDSIRHFQKIVDNYPQHEYAWHAQFTIGRCYEEMEKTGVIDKSAAQAKINAAYERLLEKYPECPAAEYAFSWLTNNGGFKEEK
jgi:TolA-binding protein